MCIRKSFWGNSQSRVHWSFSKMFGAIINHFRAYFQMICIFMMHFINVFWKTCHGYTILDTTARYCHLDLKELLLMLEYYMYHVLVFALKTKSRRKSEFEKNLNLPVREMIRCDRSYGFETSRSSNFTSFDSLFLESFSICAGCLRLLCARVSLIFVSWVFRIICFFMKHIYNMNRKLNLEFKYTR